MVLRSLRSWRAPCGGHHVLPELFLLVVTNERVGRGDAWERRRGSCAWGSYRLQPWTLALPWGTSRTGSLGNTKDGKAGSSLAQLAEGAFWVFLGDFSLLCVPTSYTPLGECCWQGLACALSPMAPPAYLFHGERTLRSSRNQGQRLLSSPLFWYLLLLSSSPVLLTQPVLSPKSEAS